MTNRRKTSELRSGSAWAGPFGEHGEHCHGEGHHWEATISTSLSDHLARWFFFSWTQIPRVLSQVQFEVADATKRVFSECSFDVIYSRDSILHIDNKPALFKRFHVSISTILGTVITVFIFRDISVNGKFSFSLFQVMAKTRWPVTDQWLLLWGKTLDASFWDLCQTERLHSLHTFTVRQGTGNTPQYKLFSRKTKCELICLCQSQVWIHGIWLESEKDIFPFCFHVKKNV